MPNTNSNQQNTPPKPHAALVSSTKSLSRYGSTIRRMIIGLLDEPMQLSFVATEGQNTEILPSPPVHIHTAPARAWGFWNNASLATIGENLLKDGVNVLHGMDLQSHTLVRKLSDISSLPYILSVHRTDKRSLIRPLGKRCFALLAESISLRDQLLGEGIIADQRVCLLKTGIYPENSISCFSHEKRSLAIITAGDLNGVEPYETVLMAFAKLRKQDFDCNFFIIGSGKAEFKLRKISRQLNLSDILTFNSTVNANQLPRIFHYGDIVIYPNTDNTLETTILEAMAAGTAILAANAGCSDILTDNETALFYRQTNSDDLASKIIGLLKNKDKATQLATKAQNYLRENHSPSVMVSELARYYRNCLLGVT